MVKGKIELLIKKKIENNFPNSYFFIENTSKKHKNHKQNIKGEETHFVITLKTHKFSKLTIIERQRYIINILGDEVIKNVHSISFKLSLPKDKNINLLKE